MGFGDIWEKTAGFFGFHPERRDLVREMEELIEEGTAEGVINPDEEEMLLSVLEFRRTLVREIMVPRTQMACVEVEASINELIEKMTSEGHSRIPVYEGDIDKIVGLAYARDLLEYWGKSGDEPSLREIVHTAYFVPETMGLEVLLAEFKRRKVHMAIAVNEYGGVSGLVTLEDVLEEIVGDILDEWDIESEPMIRELPEGFEVDGRCDMETFEEKVGVDIDLPGEYETVGGLVLGVLGRIPSPGERFANSGLEFTVRDADSRRVKSVLVRRSGKPKEENGKGERK
ncbi:HlyC/CorC family transporter [bacterium]|nr:MAG: HlyC/CorC family transporter [bacterium]